MCPKRGKIIQPLLSKRRVGNKENEKNNEPGTKMATHTTKDIVAAGGSPSTWIPLPLKVIVNVMEFIERPKQYAHLINDSGLSVDLDA